MWTETSFYGVYLIDGITTSCVGSCAQLLGRSERQVYELYEKKDDAHGVKFIYSFLFHHK